MGILELKSTITKMKNLLEGKFPGNPVVRSLHFHCQEPGIQSLVRELRSHKWHSTGKKKKKKEKEQQIKTQAKNITEGIL